MTDGVRPDHVAYEGEVDLLPPGCACPRCGERHCDRLVWREDDSGVDCSSCGHFYDPNG